MEEGRGRVSDAGRNRYLYCFSPASERMVNDDEFSIVHIFKISYFGYFWLVIGTL